MRNLITTLLTLLFIVGFFAFFLLGSVLRFGSDPDQVVEVARDSDLRGALIDATSEVAAREFNAEGGRATTAALRPAIADVVSQKWFDDNVRGAHAALVGALDEGAPTAVYDLRPVVSELGRAVDSLASRAVEQCDRFLGEAACRDREAASEVIALQRVRARNALARMPARVNVVDLLARTNEDGRRFLELREVRRRIGDLRAIRWLGLALLIGCLALIAFVNLGSGARVLGACAGALFAASLIYLVTVYAVRGPVGDRVVEQLAAWRAGSELDGPALTLAAGVERFALAAVEAATGASTGTVALLGAIGVGLGLVGIGVRGSDRY